MVPDHRNIANGCRRTRRGNVGPDERGLVMTAPTLSKCLVGGTPVEVDNEKILLGDGRVDVDLILSLAGGPEDGLVLRVDNGIATIFDPPFPLPASELAGARFRVIVDGAPFPLVVDGKAWTWGGRFATVGELLSIIGDRPFCSLAYEGVADPLSETDVIDLAVVRPPHLVTKRLIRSIARPGGADR